MLVVDLSSNNRAPNWHLLKQSGVDAVWLKASEGLTWNDPDFQSWRREANRAGLRVGAYHFARPDMHPFESEAEGRHFAATVGQVGRTDLRPVLDYERVSSHGGDERWIRSFNATVKGRLGVGPLFYTYPGLVPSLRLSGPVGYGLWLASYGRNDGKEYPAVVPSPWRKVVAHQFTSCARVAGCDGLVDLSRVYAPSAVLAFPVAGRLPWRGKH